MDTIIKEEIIDVKGTTKLTIGDPMYLENIANKTIKGSEKDLVFDGNISAAPLGKLRIRQIHTDDDQYSFDTIEVSIFQSLQPSILETYLNDKHYPDKLKKQIDLGCDTARFTIETKFGYDEFHTGTDGCYGQIRLYKRYYGMNLILNLDEGLFDFDDVKKRMLALFPERK